MPVRPEDLERAVKNAMAEVEAILGRIENQSRSAIGAGGSGSSGSIGVGAASLSGGGARARAVSGAGGGLGSAFAQGAAGRLGLAGLGPAGIAAAAGASVAGAIDDAVMRPIKNIAKDTFFNGLRNASQFGPDSNPFRGAFNQALKHIPLIGKESVDRVVSPIEKASQRTAAITTAIARGGGQVDDAARQGLFGEFLRQERSAQKELQAVEKLGATEIGSQETQTAIFRELSTALNNLTATLLGRSSAGSGTP